MDFIWTKYGILLPFFWLSFGTLGSLSEPCTTNQIISSKVTGVVTIVTIRCADNLTLTVIFYPAGGQNEKIITSSSSPTAFGYARGNSPDGDKTCPYVDAAHYAGGVYKCWVKSEPPTFAQYILVDDPVCNVVQNTEVTPPCDQKLTCNFNYSANSTYVAVNLEWSFGDPPESLEGVITRLPSADDAGLTIATSTLDVAKFPTLKPNTDIYCHPTLRLNDNLPTGFDKTKLNYNGACQTTMPIHIACPGGPSDESKGNSADGLSVGLFKRNVIMLMVGIGVLLLIGSKKTSGV